MSEKKEVKKVGKPLVKGFRDKTAALPLAKLTERVENLENQITQSFQNINQAFINQAQYLYKEIFQLKKTLELIDNAHAGLIESLDISKVLSKQKYVDAVEVVIEKKLKERDEEEDKKNNRKIVDRESKDGDIICIDYSGTCEGETFNGGAALAYNIKIGSKKFLPGFEDQLIGKKSGDKFEVKVTAPENYPEKIRNKELVFDVLVRSVKIQEDNNEKK